MRSGNQLLTKPTTNTFLGNCFVPSWEPAKQSRKHDSRRCPTQRFKRLIMAYKDDRKPADLKHEHSWRIIATSLNSCLCRYYFVQRFLKQFTLCKLCKRYYDSLSAGIATKILLLFLKKFTIITIPLVGQLQESQFVKNNYIYYNFNCWIIP